MMRLRLKIGQAQYSCLPNETGGIVDDMLVYRLPQDMCAEGEQAFMLVVNASNIHKDWDHIQQYASAFDTRIIDISDKTGLLAVQGPLAKALLQPLTDVALDDIPYYHFAKGKIAGIDNVIISATGYTGSGGFELYVDSKDLVSLWDTIMALDTSCKTGSCRTRCKRYTRDLRWAIACMAMISMIQHLCLKPD